MPGIRAWQETLAFYIIPSSRSEKSARVDVSIAAAKRTLPPFVPHMQEQRSTRYRIYSILEYLENGVARIPEEISDHMAQFGLGTNRQDPKLPNSYVVLAELQKQGFVAHIPLRTSPLVASRPFGIKRNCYTGAGRRRGLPPARQALPFEHLC